MPLDIRTPRIFVMTGAGGVGKTTLSASLAVGLAEQGFKTVVLTVDPARRLAQALGLESFSQDTLKVPLKDCKGELYSCQLDTRRHFDRIVERFASEEQKRNIFANPLYRDMVNHLGGTHEYAAMERLLEFSQDSRFEKIVIDTPPSQNAVDLLKAPERLSQFMDHSVLKWFQTKTPGPFKLFQQGSKLALKAFEKLFGEAFVQALSEFMDLIEGLQSGFQARHQEIQLLLENPSCAFWLATLPTENRLDEAKSFDRALKLQHIQLQGVILNQLEWKPEGHSSSPVSNYYGERFKQQSPWTHAFAEAFPHLPLAKIPVQLNPPHNTQALSKLAHELLS